LKFGGFVDAFLIQKSLTNMTERISSIEDATLALRRAATNPTLKVSLMVRFVGAIEFDVTGLRFDGVSIELFNDDGMYNLGPLSACSWSGSFVDSGDVFKLDLLITWPQDLARCCISCGLEDENKELPVQ
jgi:hypothetical protein